MSHCREESPAWFTAASFNAGLAAMHAEDMTAAVVLFRASGSFTDAFPAPTPQLMMTQMVRDQGCHHMESNDRHSERCLLRDMLSRTASADSAGIPVDQLHASQSQHSTHAVG
jgi:hypothetical protein